jgi:hypothetical protein
MASLSELMAIEEYNRKKRQEPYQIAGQGFQQLLDALGQYLQRKQADEQFNQMFPAQVNVAPPQQGPAQIPLAGGGMATMPRAGTASYGPSPTPDPTMLLRNLASDNPLTAQRTGRYVQGMQAIAPQFKSLGQGEVPGTVDPNTGQWTQTGPQTGFRPTPPKLPTPEKPQWVKRGNNIVYDIPQPGDLPYEKPTPPTQEPAPITSTITVPGPDGKPQQIKIFYDRNGKEIRRVVEGEQYVKPPNQAKQSEMVDKLSALESNLNEYEKLLDKVPGGRIGGTISKIGAAVELNEEARAASGLENTLAGLIARSLNGEVGVLTDQDIERAKTFLPQIIDNRGERSLKLRIIRNIIQQRKLKMERGDVSPIDPTTIDGVAKLGLSWQPPKEVTEADLNKMSIEELRRFVGESK